ncbi:MAG: hypothetical protein GY803_05205 [Chloroflexi bacterium]|nr:hypothetical protein [Chloroflexota bacterium]
MHNLAKEAYLFEYEQRFQHHDLERRRLINEALSPQRQPHILNRISAFFQTLNHVRRIRIEVKFEYREAHPRTAGC